MNLSLLYVNNTDPEDGGGGDRRLFEEAATLEDKGADVRVVASRTNPDLEQKRVSNGVQIRTVKCVPDFLQCAPSVHFYLSRSLFPLVSLPILVATLLRKDIDVIVDNHTPHPSLVAFLGPAFLTPVVALVHEYHDRSALNKYPLPVGSIQLIVQNFLRIGLYSAVIVPREQTKEALERYGTHVPIHVVPNGLKIEEYTSPPQDTSVQSFDFLVVSRLVHRKGIDQLLEAMAIATADHPSLCLGIAGAGPERERLEEMVIELGIGKNVEFLGFVSEEQKHALLHEASVFVLPSRQEGFGIAVLEAMATGLPVISNDLSVVETLLPEGNKLVDASDSAGFANQMIELLHDSGFRKRIGDRNQRESEKYDLNRVYGNLVDIYKNID